MEDLTGILGKLGVFEGLLEDHLKKIVTMCTTKSYTKGDIVFEDYTGGEDLFIVLEGKMKIKLEAVLPHYDIALSTIEAGQIFGELALIDSSPRSATVVCETDARVAVLNGAELNRLMEEDNHIGYVLMKNIARTICARLRKANRELLHAFRLRLFEK